MGNMLIFRVIIMKKNRYINATNLCNNNRKFKNQLQNNNSKDLIVDIDNKPPIIIITGGTYVHELLIPHIARWNYGKSNCEYIYCK